MGMGEVSLKLSALGQMLPGDGKKIALEHAREICQAAADAGTTVTLDMEDHTTTDATLEALRDLRQDFPWVGAVIQSYLRRSEADCRDLAHEGSRVGSARAPTRSRSPWPTSPPRTWTPPTSAASRSSWQATATRWWRATTRGSSRSPAALAAHHGRDPQTYEYQMLYGIRPEEQKRIADRGSQMRVYIPYGEEWYGYLMRRMAERPANTLFFLRAWPRRADRTDTLEAHMGTVAIFGAGVMGETLLSGLVRAGRSVDDLVITERRPERVAELREKYGVRILDNTEAAETADTLVLVVKPQDMAGLLEEISDHVRPGNLVVSLAAGITTDFLESAAAAAELGGPGHAEHPGARRRGHGRTQPRPALRRGAPRGGLGAAALVRQGRCRSRRSTRTPSRRSPAPGRRTSSTWSRR